VDMHTVSKDYSAAFSSFSGVSVEPVAATPFSCWIRW